MEDLVMNPAARLQLTALSDDPPQALVLVAPGGMGKLTIAKTWASQLTKPEMVSVVNPNDESISIDEIRTLYQVTKVRHTARQVVIVADAQSMSLEAQNAFLKLLEEPRPNVSFVLTVTNPNALLPTVMSRLQAVRLAAVSNSELETLGKKLGARVAEDKLKQLLFVAKGRPGLFTRLVQDEKLFEEYAGVVHSAKKICTGSRYQRLALVNALAKDRQGLIATLEMASQITALQIASDPSKRWTDLAGALDTCLLRVSQNGNLRAQLCRLFMA